MNKIKKSLSLNYLIMVVFTLLCFIQVYHVYGQKQSYLENIQKADSSSKTNYENLNHQISLLKERQDILIESSKQDFERVYLVFAGVAGIFTIFSIIFGLRQIAFEKHRQRIEDHYLGEMQSVMNSFRDNITTINSLISTLKQTFDFQGEINNTLARVNDQLTELQSFKESEELGYRSEVDTLNARATQLFRDCNLHIGDRISFTFEENKVKIQSLCNHFDTLKSTGNIDDYISPISLFLRALGHFNTNEYNDTAILLSKARDTAKPQLDTPLAQYGSWDVNEVKKNLEKLINETSYHLGIIYYNLGKYEGSRYEFKIAFEREPLDFRSRIYIPELMFFDKEIDPANTETEYKEVELELNNLPTTDRKQMRPSWNSHFASLKMRQGNFYLPKLIHLESRINWKKFENSESAIECYWEAKEHNPDSSFVNFSLAQSMHILGRSSLWREENPESIFRDIFQKFRNEAIMKTEPILLSLLYYCSAISCWLGKMQKENPTFYLNQARQHLQRIPKGIRIFSPINKINLIREEILKEMQQLEELF